VKDVPLGPEDAAAVEHADGPFGPLDGIRDQLDVRAGGNDARDRRSDDILRRRQWRLAAAAAPTSAAAATTLRAAAAAFRAAALVREKRADVFDLRRHDLRAAADHEVDEIFPLLRGLLVDLEHPAERGVARRADLRDHLTAMLDARGLVGLRADGDGYPHREHRDGERNDTVTH